MSHPVIDLEEEKDLDVDNPCLKEIKKEPQREVSDRRLSYSEVELETSDSYVEGSCSTSCNIKKESFDPEEPSRGRIEEDSDVKECTKSPSSSKEPFDIEVICLVEEMQEDPLVGCSHRNEIKSQDQQALMVKHEGARSTLDVDAEEQRAEKGGAGRSTSIPLLSEGGSTSCEEGNQVRTVLEELREMNAKLSASNSMLKASVEVLQKQLNALVEGDEEVQKEQREQRAMNAELKERNVEFEASNVALRKQLTEMDEAMRNLGEEGLPSNLVFQKRLDAFETVLTEKLTIVATPPVCALSIEGRFVLSKELVVAAEQDNWEKMRQLLADGADIHHKGHNGNTALHWAAWNGNMDALQYLITRGITINVSNISGNMPLHWAAWNGKVASVEALVSKGANVNARNSSCWTPLHYAARENQQKALQTLLELGADPALKDKEGKTARDVTSSSAIRAMLPE